METEQQRQQILNGNPWKILIDFSWPAVLAMFLLGANNVLDGVFVGHFTVRYGSPQLWGGEAEVLTGRPWTWRTRRRAGREIGRASCRERV